MRNEGLRREPARRGAGPVASGKPALFDSDVICAYLDTLHGGRRRIPLRARRAGNRYASRRWLGLADALPSLGNRSPPEAMRYAPLRKAISQNWSPAMTGWRRRWISPRRSRGHVALATALEVRVPRTTGFSPAPTAAHRVVRRLRRSSIDARHALSGGLSTWKRRRMTRQGLPHSIVACISSTVISSMLWPMISGGREASRWCQALTGENWSFAGISRVAPPAMRLDQFVGVVDVDMQADAGAIRGVGSAHLFRIFVAQHHRGAAEIRLGVADAPSGASRRDSRLAPKTSGNSRSPGRRRVRRGRQRIRGWPWRALVGSWS